MSEKRFTVDKVGIYDNQEKKHFKFTAYDWVDCDIYDCCEKLNEQQATINELKAQLREKEREERLYANEILELRETNEEHIKFKSLGGDY